MDVHGAATASLLGWWLILTGLVLTFVQNALPNTADGSVNRAIGTVNNVIMALATIAVEWFEADKVRRLVIVGAMVIGALLVLHYADLIPTFVQGIINLPLALALYLANEIQANPKVEILAFACAIGVTIYLPLLIFLWLSRLHPGGAIGVAGLCFQTPDIIRDISLVLA